MILHRIYHFLNLVLTPPANEKYSIAQAWESSIYRLSSEANRKEDLENELQEYPTYKCYPCARVKPSNELKVVFNYRMAEFQVYCKDEKECDAYFEKHFVQRQPRPIKDDMATLSFQAKHNITSEEMRTKLFLEEIQTRKDFLEW